MGERYYTVRAFTFSKARALYERGWHGRKFGQHDPSTNKTHSAKIYQMKCVF